MDVSITNADSQFILRSAAIIIHNNHLLTATAKGDQAYYTIGGKVHVGETTMQAALRETYEETGHAMEIDRLLYVQERFYEHCGKAHHEVVFFYLLKGDCSHIREGDTTDQPDHESLHWISLERLEQVDLLPEFLKSALLKPTKQIQHIVSDERVVIQQ